MATDDALPFDGSFSSAELRTLSRRTLRRRPGMRASSLMIGVGVLVAVVGAIQLMRLASSGPIWTLWGVVLILVSVGLRWSERRAIARQAKATTWRGAVEAEGVRIQTESAETLYRWSSFVDRERHGTLVLLVLENGTTLPLSTTMFENRAAAEAAVARLEGAIPDRSG